MKPATEETELQEGHHGFDLLTIYPFTFALLSCLAFLGAMVKMVYLATNPSVKYWMGNWPMYIALLPLLFIVLAYFIHQANRGLPSKWATILGLLGPSLMLFVGGYKVAMQSLTLSAAFTSADCVSNHQMYHLGLAWEKAVDFRSECKGPPGSDMLAPSIIQECAGYEDALENNPSWNYLAHLEQSTGCGGWCVPATTLWIYPGGVQDPCSSAAGESLATEILYPSMQVTIFDICFVFLATTAIAMLGPGLSKHSIEW